MLEDKQLIRKMRQGSREALEQLYEKYEGFLITVAVALCQRMDWAEDVVQDFFVAFAPRMLTHGGHEAIPRMRRGPSPSRQAPNSRLPKTLAAAAAVRGIGIIEFESRLVERIHIVDFYAVYLVQAGLVNGDMNAVELAAPVRAKGFIHNTQLILEAGAASLQDLDPQYGIRIAMLLHDVLDLCSGRW